MMEYLADENLTVPDIVRIGSNFFILKRKSQVGDLMDMDRGISCKFFWRKFGKFYGFGRKRMLFSRIFEIPWSILLTVSFVHQNHSQRV